MNSSTQTLKSVLTTTLTLLCGATVLAEYELSRATIDGGGVIQSSGGSYTLNATIGQPDAGQMNGGSYVLTGGFWFEEPAGDCDATGIVDLLDYEDLSECLAGPDAGLSEPSCSCFDFDDDDDTDLLDFAEFQEVFAG